MKEEILLTIEPEDKDWLEKHPWVNASGLLRDSIHKLRKTID